MKLKQSYTKHSSCGKGDCGSCDKPQSREKPEQPTLIDKNAPSPSSMELSQGKTEDNTVQVFYQCYRDYPGRTDTIVRCVSPTIRTRRVRKDMSLDFQLQDVGIFKLLPECYSNAGLAPSSEPTDNQAVTKVDSFQKTLTTTCDDAPFDSQNSNSWILPSPSTEPKAFIPRKEENLEPHVSTSGTPEDVHRATTSDKVNTMIRVSPSNGDESKSHQTRSLS